MRSVITHVTDVALHVACGSSQSCETPSLGQYEVTDRRASDSADTCFAASVSSEGGVFKCDGTLQHVTEMWKFVEGLENDTNKTQWHATGVERNCKWALPQIEWERNYNWVMAQQPQHLAVICTAGTEKTQFQCNRLANAMEHLGW